MRRGFASPGTLILLIGILLAVGVLIVGLRLAREASFGREIGTALIYAPDHELSVLELQKTVGTLKYRINTDWWSKARIQWIPGGKIDIGIYGTDRENARRIQELIERAGTLEFRVLANKRDHGAIIEQARKNQAAALRAKKKDDKGEYPILAWWVPLQEGRNDADKKRAESVMSHPEIATRTVKEGETEVRQVLVVKDAYDVNGQYLQDVFPGIDVIGKPCVVFRLNEEGGRRFAGLTGDNLPEPNGAFSRKLGIILDGRLYSAPSIQVTIFHGGEIAGEFTEEEVDDLVSTLKSGPLPVKLKLVEKRVVETKAPK